MKFFILSLIFTSIYSSTYFGEYIECGIYDKCITEYKACQSDTICNYNMYSSPCISPCGVNYTKFFSQMRNYSTTFDNQEILTLFPDPSCNFTACQENWVQTLGNANLTALKKCEIKNCMMAYPSYTFIAHSYKELQCFLIQFNQILPLECTPLLKTCVDTDPQCLAELVKAEKCVQDKGLTVDPQTTPNKYFKEPISSFMGKFESCYPDPTVVQIDDYTKLINCLKQVWN